MSGCFPTHIIWISVKRFFLSVVCGQWCAVFSWNLSLSHITDEYNCRFVCFTFVLALDFSETILLFCHLCSVVCSCNFIFFFFGWLACMESINCSTVLLRKVVKESSFSNVWYVLICVLFLANVSYNLGDEYFCLYWQSGTLHLYYHQLRTIYCLFLS